MKPATYNYNKNFIDALTTVCQEISNRESKNQKYVYDVFGRVYLYDNIEDLKNIELDENTKKMTELVASTLL